MPASAQEVLTVDHEELDRLFTKALDAIDRADPMEAFQCVDLFWARLAVHIRAEHLKLFPALLQAEDNRDSTAVPGGEIREVLNTLHNDHDFFMRELARAIKALRLVFDFGNEAETFVIVRSLLEGVRERLIEHNRIEEEIVYPMSGGDHLGTTAGELTLCVEKELKNLPPRFRGPQYSK